MLKVVIPSEHCKTCGSITKSSETTEHCDQCEKQITKNAYYGSPLHLKLNHGFEPCKCGHPEGFEDKHFCSMACGVQWLLANWKSLYKIHDSDEFSIGFSINIEHMPKFMEELKKQTIEGMNK